MSRTIPKKLLTLLAVVSVILTLGLSQAASAAKGGIPGPPDTGEDTTPNSLSVPVINVDTVSAPFACALPALVMPTGTQIYYPTGFDNPIVTPPEGGALPDAGYYYIQGEATWQAECGTTTDMLDVSADWGDNLGGDAKLSIGLPVRVEVGLLVDTAAHPEYADLQGFEVVKLTEELDRNATYGTLGVAEDLGEVRAYDDGARLRIIDSSATVIYDEPFSAELNSTGRIVYGYNWRPTAAGDFTLEFSAPAVNILNGVNHTTTISVTVVPSNGGGGGGGGGAGGGGGRGGGGGVGGGGGPR